MKKNSKLITFSIIILIIFGISITLFYVLGNSFAKAIVNTANGIRNAKIQWEKDGVNPLDSVENIILDSIDKIEDIDTSASN